MLTQKQIDAVKSIVEDMLGRGDDDRVLCAFGLNYDSDYGRDAHKEAQLNAIDRVYENFELMNDVVDEEDEKISLEEAVKDYVYDLKTFTPSSKRVNWYI